MADRIEHVSAHREELQIWALRLRPIRGYWANPMRALWALRFRKWLPNWEPRYDFLVLRFGGQVWEGKRGTVVEDEARRLTGEKGLEIDAYHVHAETWDEQRALKRAEDMAAGEKDTLAQAIHIAWGQAEAANIPMPPARLRMLDSLLPVVAYQETPIDLTGNIRCAPWLWTPSHISRCVGEAPEDLCEYRGRVQADGEAI